MIQSSPIPASFAAGVLEGPRRLTVREIPQWPLADYGDDDLVLIEVAACGVCGSDFRYYLGENPWAQHTLGRFVPNPPNIVLGHEYAGTVVAVLSEANRHWLGKRVAPICSKICGNCVDCRSGQEHLCPNTVHMGHGQGWGDRPFFPGAYGRYAPAWGAGCYEIPDHVTFPEAAMMDILAVCVHVARMGEVQPGRPVLCIGAGPAGNGIAQAALAMGASQAVLIDRSEAALAVARAQSVGTPILVDGPLDDSLGQSLRAIAPDGFGSVFDSVGHAESLHFGISMLGKRGTLVNLAVHDDSIPINPMSLGSERRFVTSCNFETPDFKQALAWLSDGRMRVQNWLTPVRLEEVPARFEAITSEAEKSVFKLVIEP